MASPPDKQQRVLLLNPPHKHKILRDYYCCTHSKTGYLWHPIDLLVQSGILGARHVIAVCDAVSGRLSPEAALRATLGFEPTAVFSLIGALTLDADLAFLETLKQRTGATIFVSGDATLADPHRFLEQYPWIRGVLFDFTSRDILSLLDGDADSVTSAAFRTGNHVQVRRTPGHGEFHYPLPAHFAFAGRAYNMPCAPAGFASVLSTFGCPYACSFCNSGARSLGFRFRGQENLRDEILHLYAHGTRHIFFKDMTFGIDRNRTERICRLLMDNAPDLTWHAYTRVDLLDQRTIELYADSGCRLLQMGLETEDENDTLQTGKKISPSKIKDIFERLRNAGITSGAHFILGLPGARAVSDVKTIVQALRLNPGYASFNAFTPRPGAELANAPHPEAGRVFLLKLLLRAAYIGFYMRPRRILGLLKRGRASVHNQSVWSFLRYLVFLPDVTAPRTARRASGRGI